MIDKKVILVVQTKNLRHETMKKAEIEITEDQMRNQGFIQELLEQLGRLTDTEMVYDFKEKPLKYFNAHIQITKYGVPEKPESELRFIVQANNETEARSHVYCEMEKVLARTNREVNHIEYRELEKEFAEAIIANNVSTLFDSTDYFVLTPR